MSEVGLTQLKETVVFGPVSEITWNRPGKGEGEVLWETAKAETM
jgi:hypothetical protein